MLKPLPLSDLVTLRAEFNRCWDWLWKSLCEFGPTHSKEQVWHRILKNQAYLWPGRRCVILGEIIAHPIGINSFNYWLQGGDENHALAELLSMHAGIEAWAVANGCNVALGSGRKAWSRVMHGDWHDLYTVRRKQLSQRLPSEPRRIARGLETTPAAPTAPTQACRPLVRQ